MPVHASQAQSVQSDSDCNNDSNSTCKHIGGFREQAYKANNDSIDLESVAYHNNEETSLC